MHDDQETRRSIHGANEPQRRQRTVHKIRLGDLDKLSSAEIAQMLSSGDIELMVRRTDMLDTSDGGWGHRIGSLFENVANGLTGAPEHENRTIIVNIVASGAGRAHD